ncbi:MAG: HAD family hydrolase [Chloroflexi bacterium]|nr:MAG: HAD family hydrolase [Chloroflexota bacterium]
MIRAVLLDLDDTLLGNETEGFMRAYFSILGEWASELMDRDRFLRVLLMATREVIRRQDTAVSNRDLFWHHFQALSGLDPEALEPFFDRFYEQMFPKLASLTQPRPVARALVQTCLEHGYKVVVATNPLFPRRAIEERLRWAGVPVSEFPYTLVTSYENMHAAKPNPAYYRQILEMIDCPADAAIMVGDDWENDIKPAAGIGMFTYWLPADGEEPPDLATVTAFGSLEQFYELVCDGWLQQISSYSRQESV